MNEQSILKSEKSWEPVMRSVPGYTDQYTGQVINQRTDERIYMPGLGEALLLCEILTERDALAAENARLRAALEAVRDKDFYATPLDPNFNELVAYAEFVRRLKHIARAALEGSDHE